MLQRYTAILKSNSGELEALVNLQDRTARKIVPLFEFNRLTDAVRARKYIQESSTPITTYLNRQLDAVGRVWSERSAMIDGYQWPPHAQTEGGEHVIAYLVESLRARDVSVIPVIGYDRWENPVYKQGMKAIRQSKDDHFCLRLDSSAFEDAAEPDLLQETVSDIVEELALEPSRCSILIDFGDISTAGTSIEALVATSEAILRQLQPFEFSHYIIAGCSLPKSIDLAVSNRNSTGMILRKEMLVWQALRQSFPSIRIIYGDYGVRGPTTTEAHSRYTNGKIRHTTSLQMYIARGHAFFDDHSNAQMHGLARTIMSSPHFLGEAFSWGDSQILLCGTHGAFGNPGKWIAIDTNHHVTFVVQEVEEFERVFATRNLAAV